MSGEIFHQHLQLKPAAAGSRVNVLDSETGRLRLQEGNGLLRGGGHFLRQRLDAGLRHIAFFVVPSAMAFLALGDDCEGFFGPSQWEPGLRQPIDLGPTAEWFVQAYAARTGELPDYPAAQAYAAGLLASRCARDAGLEQRALREAASRLRCTTLYGSFAIDRSGRQVAHEVVVVRWEHGQKRLTA